MSDRTLFVACMAITAANLAVVTVCWAVILSR